MTRGRLLLLCGIGVLVAVALLMPSGWYDALPHQPDVPPPPVSGVLLFRLTLLVEAAVLAWIVAKRMAYQPLPARAPEREREERNDWDLAPRTATWLLVVVTLGGLALRLFRASSDLWIDEIVSVAEYGSLPVAQVIGSYLHSNNHLLNTLLLKLAIAIFGEREWAVRLPAIIFGVATIPTVYWAARAALPRWASVGAALLVAVSYHHIFFSQNARGYTAYLFFALVATRLLTDGLHADRLRTWVLYTVAICLGFASLLNTAFVLAAHGIVGAVAIAMLRRRGLPAWPLARRLAVVFAAAGFLSFQLYAIALPEVYVVITHVYRQGATGFAPLSMEFVREILRGVTAGFGTSVLLAAVPFLAGAAMGFVALVRRNWALALGLTLPGVLTATFLIVRGLTFSPRFFLLWLPLAILAAAAALVDIARFASRRIGSPLPTRIAFASVLVLATLSLASLGRYYTVPKQSYRAALDYVEQARGPSDVVVVLFTAGPGVRYYGARMGAPLDRHYRFVRSTKAFDSALAAHGSGQVLLLTTFERGLRLEEPELYDRVTQGYVVEREFPATIGDGSIKLWREQPLPVGQSSGGPPEPGFVQR